MPLKGYPKTLHRKNKTTETENKVNKLCGSNIINIATRNTSCNYLPFRLPSAASTSVDDRIVYVPATEVVFELLNRRRGVSVLIIETSVATSVQKSSFENFLNKFKSFQPPPSLIVDVN